MRKLLIYILLIYLPGQVFGQPELGWDRTFVSQFIMNQSDVVMDHEGNTWCHLMTQGEMSFPEIGFQIPRPQQGKEVFVRLDKSGKVDRVVDTQTKTWRGMGAIACGPDNGLYILSVYDEGMSFRTPAGEKAVKADSSGYRGLVLTAITAEGVIRFAKNVYLKNSDNTIDLAVDGDGNIHVIVQWTRTIYEPNQRSYDSYDELHLKHAMLNNQGEMQRSDDFVVDGMYKGSLIGSQIHVTLKNDYYVSMRFAKDVKMNGHVIVPDMNPQLDQYTRNESSAVLIHFNKNGEYSWHRTLSGYGAQVISGIASDSTNVYITALFSYECLINQKNKIIYDYHTPTTSSGLLVAGMDHRGNLKWTRQLATRNYSGAYLNCYGLETDHRGQLAYFCNFSDSIAVHGLYKDYILKYDRSRGGCTFFMLGDTMGNILDVRSDLEQKVGSTINLGSGACDSLFAVTGFYLPVLFGYHWDEEHKRYLDNGYDTRIRVQIGNQFGQPFPPIEGGAGIFVYSFIQPKFDPTPANVILSEPMDTSLFVQVLPTLQDTTGQWKPGGQQLPSDSPLVWQVLEPGAPIDLQLRVFPNPTRRNLNIEIHGLSDLCELLIMDSKGALVFSKSFFVDTDELALQYDVSDWAADTYLLVVRSSGNKQMTSRWIKTG